MQYFCAPSLSQTWPQLPRLGFPHLPISSSLAHYTPHSSDGPVGLLVAVILDPVNYLVHGFTSGFRPIFRYLAPQ